jgi:hypothetical protein
LAGGGLMPEIISKWSEYSNLGVLPLMLYFVWRMERRITILEMIVNFLREEKKEI